MSELPPFFTRYGFSRPAKSTATLVIRPYPEICTSGALRATVVASAIDLVGGLIARAAAGVDATFTSDLSLRIPKPETPNMIVAVGTPLRTGKRLVSTGVTLTSDNTVYAYGETTFSRIARAASDAPDLAKLSTPQMIPSHPLDRPLEQEVGLNVLDPSSGRVCLSLRPALLNPEGIMQGALVALVVECAALAIATASHAGPQVVTELDMRYLASASEGPVESEAKWVGTAATRILRIELRDAGKGHRLTTTALVRVADA